MKFLLRNWFLIALVIVLAVGLTWPAQLEPVMDRVPRSWLVAAVMFLMALPMPFAQFAATVRNSGPAWLAIAISTGLAPLLGWSLGIGLPTTLSAGLVVATSVPCTMASAAIWTRRGGGNDAIALLVTIVTSLACFVVLPTWLWVLLRREVAIEFSALSLELLLRVVLPIVAAQLLRRVSQVGLWATRHRTALSTTSQLGILLMLLVGAVASSNVLASSAPSREIPTILDWAYLLTAAMAVHCLLLLIGWRLSRWMGWPYEDTLAVAISGSQKTLPVGLEVAPMFGGLAVLPMVVYHVSQLIIDTLVIERFRPTRHELEPGGSESRGGAEAKA